MAGIVYEPPATPAAQPLPPVAQAGGFSPQTFRDKSRQYDDLLGAVLSQRTTGWLDGLAKVATAGLLGYKQRENQDKADSARAGASADTSRLLEAMMGGGKSTAAMASAPGSDKLTNALVQSRGGPATGGDVFGDGKLPGDMVHKESRGNQFAANGKPLTSSAGAIGIAQVMPGTAPEAARLAGVPFDDNRYRTDAAYNEQLGAAYYDAQMGKYGDPELARAAYNAGPGRVDQYIGQGRSLPAETVAYADLNGDGRIGGSAGADTLTGGALGPQPNQGPQVASLGAGDMPMTPGGPEMPASMQPGYQPIGSQAPQQPQASAGQGGNEQLQAALAIMSNPWADDGQKQVAGLILAQAMKQDQPVNGIEMGNRLVNPRTGAVMADFSDQNGGGAFEGKAADIQAANYLVSQGKMTREQAAQWLLARQAVGPNGQVDLITPDALTSGQSVGGAPAVMNGQPMGAAPPVQQAAGAQQPGVVTVRQPGMANVNVDQANAGLYADRMRKANVIIDQFGTEGQDRVQNFKAGVPFFGNSMVSSGYQQNDQAQRDFVTATLRRESGAAISESEFDNARKQYFPQPGDGPDVIEQKRQNRLTAIEGISRAAGPAYFKEEQAAQPQAAPAPRGVGGAAPGNVIRYDAQGNRIQ